MPINIGDLFNKRRPHPSQMRSARAIEPNFPSNPHMKYIFEKESAGDIIRKIFEEGGGIGDNQVKEASRILRVRLESSPFAHIPYVYAIGSNRNEGMTLLNPHISCNINGKMIHRALCDIEAHVSMMKSKIYNELFAESSNLCSYIH